MGGNNSRLPSGDQYPMQLIGEVNALLGVQMLHKMGAVHLLDRGITPRPGLAKIGHNRLPELARIHANETLAWSLSTTEVELQRGFNCFQFSFRAHQTIPFCPKAPVTSRWPTFTLQSIAQR